MPVIMVSNSYRGLEEVIELVPSPISLAAYTLSSKSTSGTITNGGLTFSSSPNFGTARTNGGVPSGNQAYWEVHGNLSSVYVQIGMTPALDLTTYPGHVYLPVGGTQNPSVLTSSAGVDIGQTASSAYGWSTGAHSPMTTVDTGYHITADGDTFGFALDNRVGGKKLYMHKNGYWFGGDGTFATAQPIVSNIPNTTFYPAISAFSVSATTINLGATAFEYTPPAGYA